MQTAKTCGKKPADNFYFAGNIVFRSRNQNEIRLSRNRWAREQEITKKT
jgi:hypothetical protein